MAMGHTPPLGLSSMTKRLSPGGGGGGGMMPLAMVSSSSAHCSARSAPASTREGG